MNPSSILVLGAGGREHALAWRLARDPHAPRVVVAPGNDGIAAGFECRPLRELEAAAVLGACREVQADLVVVGPEAPLAAGLADALRGAGCAVFGPGAGAARLEASKWFAKEIMTAAGVPTARGEMFEESAAAIAALRDASPPFVVKADGLAAGKGVLVTPDRAEAERFVRASLEDGRFGAGGRQVVIEEHLAGEEASLMAVCDGRDFVMLPAARDYKRAFAGDAGPNTGGMGSYAPSAAVTAALEEEIGARVIAPVLATMAARGTPFMGLLYCGLMLTAAGPRVIEFNVRFGDPETQSVLPLVGGSLSTLLASAAAGVLDRGTIARVPGAAVTVALVTEGYPGTSVAGGWLTGLERAQAHGVHVFHAGTTRTDRGWELRGGRGAYLTATGVSIEEARDRVYAALAELAGGGWRARMDIAFAPTAAKAAGV